MPNSERLLSMRFVCCLVLFAGLIPCNDAFARTGPPIAANATGTLLFAADDAADAEDDQTVLSWIHKSGWSGYLFMGLLALFSVVALTITLERLVNLAKEKILPEAFLARFNELVRQKTVEPEPYRQLCGQHDATIATILKAGLLRAGRPLTEVEKAMEDAAARETSAIRSKSKPLTVIGAVAPLVGLLGTVVGMIIAFRTTSQEGTGKAELLAEGIYLALLTTAVGLTIAIPTMLLAAYFNSKLERFMRETDEHLMDAMPCFAEMENRYDVRLLPERAQQPAEQKEPEQELATAQT